MKHIRIDILIRSAVNEEIITLLEKCKSATISLERVELKPESASYFLDSDLAESLSSEKFTLYIHEEEKDSIIKKLSPLIKRYRGVMYASEVEKII